MTAIKKLQDIHIEPLTIPYVGSKEVLSDKNKKDLLKIINKQQLFNNQSLKETPSISSEKAVLLLQVNNKKLNMNHLDELTVKVLAKKVDQLAQKLLVTEPKSFRNAEVISPLADAFSLPVTFSLKFIHSFQNALLSSAKVGSSAASVALITDAVQDYKKATKAHDSLATRFALFQGLYATLQGILGAEALSLTFVNLLESNMVATEMLKYTGTVSGILTVLYLNLSSAFRLYRHNNIMSPVENLLKDESISDIQRNDQIAKYLQNQISITPEDMESSYKHALQAVKKNKNQNLDGKIDSYLVLIDEWYSKNAHKLLDGSEEDPVSELELLEAPFRVAFANELARLHTNKISTFEKYMGPTALKHTQSMDLSNEEIVTNVVKDAKAFRKKQYIVIALSILAAISLAVATVTTGGISIAASVLFIGILVLSAYGDISNLLSKLKDHMLTNKEMAAMGVHVLASIAILATTVGIGIATGAALPLVIAAGVIATLPVLLYTYILFESNRQSEKQVSESTRKILSESL